MLLTVEILNTMSHLVIAGLRGNAGAGGAMLALAADYVYSASGVVLNPHYRGMGELYGSEYWKKVFNIDALVDTGAISPKDIELFQYADTPEDAFELLCNGLTENYLIPEANAAAEQSEHDPVAPHTFEEFLGPGMAKMSR